MDDEEQEQEHVELPRARVGGLKQGPVEDLLRRIARDYSMLERENHELLQNLEEASGVREARAPGADPAAQGETRTAARPGDAEQAVVSRGPLPRSAEATAGQSGLQPGFGPSDELVLSVLAVARRAAHEMREGARTDCELMIKKTRQRVARLESELERTRAAHLAELDELERLKHELREELRRSLQTFLETFAAEAADPPTLD
jgi:hypothetical protein